MRYWNILRKCVTRVARSCFSKYGRLSAVAGIPGIASGGSGNFFGRVKPSSSIESWGRSPNRGREAPDSNAQSTGVLRPKPKPRVKPEKKRGKGSGEGVRWTPPPEIFWKIKLEIIHFGAYLRQKFQINDNMHDKTWSWYRFLGSEMSKKLKWIFWPWRLTLKIKVIHRYWYDLCYLLQETWYKLDLGVDSSIF